MLYEFACERFHDKKKYQGEKERICGKLEDFLEDVGATSKTVCVCVCVYVWVGVCVWVCMCDKEAEQKWVRKRESLLFSRGCTAVTL